jgi:hypothetical protein
MPIFISGPFAPIYVAFPFDGNCVFRIQILPV